MGLCSCAKLWAGRRPKCVAPGNLMLMKVLAPRARSLIRNIPAHNVDAEGVAGIALTTFLALPPTQTHCPDNIFDTAAAQLP